MALRSTSVRQVLSVAFVFILMLSLGLAVAFHGRFLESRASASRPPETPFLIYPSVAGPFSFGAAGDYGFGNDAKSVMTQMGISGLDFVLMLGDAIYDTTTEQTWCNYFETRVGDGKVLLIGGNHDTGEDPYPNGGNINTL